MQKAILLLLLVLPIAAFSQKDFRPGFVVLNNGDTVRGLILYRLGSRISDECTYRATKKGETRVYKANELQSYAVTNDKYYASMALDSATKEKVFVEKLVTGKVSIFRYHDTFFAEKDKLYKLEKSVKKVNDKNVWYEQEYKKYAGTLNFLTLDCGSMGGKAFNADLNEHDLVGLAVEYNRCMDHPYVDYKQFKPHHTISYYPIVGVSSTNLSFSSDYYHYITSKRTTVSSVAPAYGVGVEFVQPRSIENLSANIELIFSNHHFSDLAENERNMMHITEDINIDYSRLRIPLSLKYNFTTGQTSPYVRFGFMMNLFFNGHIKVYQTSTNVNDPSIEAKRLDDEDIDNLPVPQFWGAFGVQRRIGNIRAFIEFRAEVIGGEGNSSVRQKTADPVIVMDAKSVGLSTLSGLIGIYF
jgi:hypothetical protein